MKKIIRFITVMLLILFSFLTVQGCSEISDVFGTQTNCTEKISRTGQ